MCKAHFKRRIRINIINGSIYRQIKQGNHRHEHENQWLPQHGQIISNRPLCREQSRLHRSVNARIPFIAILHSRLVLKIPKRNNKETDARSSVFSFDHENTWGRPRNIEWQNVKENLDLSLRLDLLPEEIFLFIFSHVLLLFKSLFESILRIELGLPGQVVSRLLVRRWENVARELYADKLLGCVTFQVLVWVVLAGGVPVGLFELASWGWCIVKFQKFV